MLTWKVWIKGLFGLILFFVVPFLIAGRWDLPMIWAYIGVYGGFLLISWFAVFRKDPHLLREGQHPGPGAKQWNRAWLTIYSVVLFGNWILAFLDVGRFHWSDSVPFWLQIVGLLGFTASLAFAGWALAENTFFSEVVRIQHDRGHYVLTTGPYRYVRHPGYLGNMVALPCSALGSWLALLPAGLIVVLYVVRTSLEDRTLQQELPGYPEYAQQVRHRLVPGVW